MLLIIKTFDGDVKTIRMEHTDYAFTGCVCESPYDDCECGSGYIVPKDDDFIIGDGEYVGHLVLSCMYEMGCPSGSFPLWSWALVPENPDEVFHLQKQCTERASFGSL